VVGLALIAAGLMLFEADALGDFRIDDALISFSFSKNLAARHGLVYSHGLRVEGFSNFLWVVLVAGPLALFPRADVFTLARLCNLPFLVLLFGGTYALVRRRAGVPFAALAVVVLAASADLTAALLSGLETVAYTALLTAGLALYAHQDSPRARRAVVPCFVLAALTRIDGMVPLSLILAIELVEQLRTRGFSLRRYLRWAGPGVAAYLAWFAWRWWYFGALLPSTYYAKALIPVAAPGHGLAYVTQTLTAWGVVIVLPLLLLGAAHTLGRPRRLPALAPAILCVVHVGYVVHVGGDWMPFGRFLLPILPALVALMATGVAAAASWPRWSAARIGAGVLATAYAGLFAVFIDGHRIDARAEREKIDGVRGQIPIHRDQLFPAAKLMAKVVRPGERLVSDFTGVFAYFTEAKVIDMWGLANLTIAREGTTDGVNPVFGKTCPPCYLDFDPDYFHVNFPLIRAADALADQRAVTKAVWQSNTIGRYLNFDRDFVAGRIIDLRTRAGLFFLERRRPGKRFAPRAPAPDLVVDYPFEPGGASPLL
jgi:arabinofuranosyltransferase